MADLRERIRLSDALNDLDLRIHSMQRFEEIMQATLDAFVRTLGADAGDVKLFDDEQWVVEYVCGFDPEIVGLMLAREEAPVAECVAELRKPVVITDYLAEPESFYVGFPERFHLRATLAVPLFVRERVVGSIFAWMKDAPREFSEAEVDFGRRIAASVSLAVENARLLEAANEARARAETAESQLAEELDRTRVLLRAADELSSTTDLDELLDRLAGLLKEATGLPRAFVNLVDTRLGLLTSVIAPDGGLRALSGPIVSFDDLSETSKRAFTDREPAVLDYELSSTPERDRRIAEANNARKLLFVPLIHQDAVIGQVALDRPGERYDFTPEQVRLVTSICAQASVALHNALLFAREHRIAEVLQSAILIPPESVEGLDISCAYEPSSTSANVGGDFYDVFRLPDGRAAVLVGDVAGKGVEAARLTMLVRDGIRAALLDRSDPCDALVRANRLIHRFTPTERFATVFLGILDPATGELSYASAGHPPAVIVGPTGVRRLAQGRGLLGAFPGIECDPSFDTLAPGETLCAYTDGLTEARGTVAPFGDDGVFRAIEGMRDRAPAEIPRALLEAVRTYADGVLRDDVVILCVGRPAAQAPAR